MPPLRTASRTAATSTTWSTPTSRRTTTPTYVANGPLDTRIGENNYRGPYAAGTTYTAGDSVRHIVEEDPHYWVALSTTTGVEPAFTAAAEVVWRQTTTQGHYRDDAQIERSVGDLTAELWLWLLVRRP